MDAIDIKIIRKLRAGGRSEFDPFPTNVNSLRYVASALKLDKETVRRRIANLKKKEAFSGWSVMINPNIFSLKATKVWLKFESEEARKRAIDELSKTRTIRTMVIYFEETISFIFVSHSLNSLEPQLEVLRARVGRFEILRRTTISFPSCTMKLSTSDRNLYEAVRNGFQKSQFDISKEAGISLRTVKRKLSELIEENAFLLLSGWNPKKVEGVPFELFVGCPNPKKLAQFIAKISREFYDSLLSVEQYEEPSSSLAFITKNVFEASNCLKFARAQDEPVQVELNLIQEVLRVRQYLRLGV
jgi:DNA-binding Lrp family transcriptional regulator